MIRIQRDDSHFRRPVRAADLSRSVVRDLFLLEKTRSGLLVPSRRRRETYNPIPPPPPSPLHRRFRLPQIRKPPQSRFGQTQLLVPHSVGGRHSAEEELFHLRVAVD